MKTNILATIITGLLFGGISGLFYVYGGVVLLWIIVFVMAVLATLSVWSFVKYLLEKVV